MRTTTLQRLLGRLDAAEFLESHWLRAPTVLRGAVPDDQRQLADWSAVQRLVLNPECDLLFVRDAVPHRGARPAQWDQAQALFRDGYSIVLRQPEQHDAGLAELGRALALELHAQLNLHVYATPRAHGSFGWHCDPEEVFILQCSGQKRYDLRRNTVHPNPLLEALGSKEELAKETSPTESFLLEAGDLLYIPGGWWHATEALQDAVSISVGLMPPTPIAVLDFLRAELLRREGWRERFPPFGHAAPGPDAAKVARHHQLVAQLGEAMAEIVKDPRFSTRFFAAWAVASLRRR